MAVPSVSLAVVGAAHKNSDGTDRWAEIEQCETAEAVELIAEPENKFDRHAIAVYSCRGVQIGYVSAERAPRIGTLLADHDTQAVFQRVSDFGAWIRVSFDGHAPKLTDAMLLEPDEAEVSPPDAEPDFYADEIWPDD